MAEYAGIKFEPVPMIPECEEPPNKWVNTDGRICNMCNKRWAGDGDMVGTRNGPYGACIGGLVTPMSEVDVVRARRPELSGRQLRTMPPNVQCPQWAQAEREGSNQVRNYEPAPAAIQTAQEKALATAQAWCERYVKNNGRNGGMVIQGPPGVGKSHLAFSIMEPTIARANYQTFGISSTELHGDILSDFNNSAAIVKSLSGWQLLLIDDLGSEPSGNESFNAALQALYDNIERRNDQSIIITTNLTSKQITERYGQRVMDRMKGHCSKSNGGAMIAFPPETPSFRSNGK